MRKHGKFIVISALLLALLATPLALGAGEGRPLDGGARNPSNNRSQAYNRETEVIANTSTYGTRQSNKSNNGGGAIYGCRSRPGGTAARNEPCLRATNIRDGLAFELSTNGALAGTITTGRPGENSKPFTTNATGVATGLNADRLDGQDATDLVRAGQALHPFAQVSAAGTAGQTRGVAANGVSRTAPGVYSVVFTGNLNACAVTATITGTDPGEITVTPAPAATTPVVVRTFTSEGTPADRAFTVTASC
ncbi:MAG: hypothetical protein M3296_04585 [Actinomycetota bacterium]|nr:hypothetical protein [Actinomycetota bacterium]